MQRSDQDRGAPKRIARAVDSSSENQVDFSKVLAIFWGGKWLLLAGAVLGLLGSLCYLAVTPNTYESDSLVQVQNSDTSALNGLGGLVSDNGAAAGQSVAESEIPIIKSREVIGGAVKDLDLTTSVVRDYIPVLGPILYGPAQMHVKNFTASGAWQGQNFTLRTESDGQFIVLGPEGGRLGEGKVNKAFKVDAEDGRHLELLVDGFSGGKGATFVVSKTPWLAKVHEVQSEVDVTEVGDKSGILSLSITGQDKHHITNVLNSVVQNYVRQNIESKSQEASQSLKFLNSQLPKLKKKVNKADERLAEYQEKNQPVELDAQAQSYLGQASNLEDKKSQLQLKIAQLRQQYTDQYPELEAAERQYADINQQVNKLQRRINQLPSDQKTLLALQRDVKVNTDLYTSLLNRAQSLQIVKAGTIGNVRVIDPAVIPLDRVSPKPIVAIICGLFLGTVLAGLFLVIRAAARRGVSDPAELETHTGLSVYGVVPYSGWMEKRLRRHVKSDEAPLLARDHPSDVVVEALRSLRTGLQFTQMERGANVVMVTGPAPGVGKSFLSLNLGHLSADASKKVLVIDADMRRGHLHEALPGTERGAGLSEILTGNALLADAVRIVPGSNLKLISSGSVPPNPAELLMAGQFATLIEEAKASYDLVIVDAPPVLAVTDAGIIANSIENVIAMMVLRSGKHPWKEIDEAVARFERQGGQVSGIVLNGYRQDQEQSRYGYGHYQYAYASRSN